MEHLLIPITNACTLVTLNYIALKIRNEMFIQSYESITIPVLTGVASIVMMLQPFHMEIMELDLRFAPIIMAGLRFGFSISLLSTILPALYCLGIDDGHSLFGVVLGLLLPAIISSWFHRVEYRTGYTRIQMIDGIKICLIYFILHITVGTMFISVGELDWIVSNLLLLGTAAASILMLIVMFNDESNNWLMQRQLELLANQDGLTKLPNLRSFMEIADRTLQRKKFAILMIDIDHFKVYNDCLGHLQGDQLLRDVGHVLRNGIGEQDYAARYGGEEFIIMCNSNDPQKLDQLALKLCHAVASHPFVHREVQPFKYVSISVGISVARTVNDDLIRIIAEADEALYASKKGGRNRFTFYKDHIRAADQACSFISSGSSN